MRKLWCSMKKFYRVHFLGVELILTLILLALSVMLTAKYIGLDVVQNNLNGTRTSLYGTIAAVAGAMLGFVITGLSVLLTTNNNEQMERLRKSKHYKKIFVIFFSTSKYLGLLLITSLVSLVLDKDDSPIITLTLISISLSVIVGIRLLRCIWVLEKIVQIQILKK